MNETSQSLKAYETIKKNIISRKLKPGYPIIETELSKELNMSRTPIREAIRLLSSEGLVDIIPRKGTFIKSINKADLIMCYEAAEALEGMIAYIVTTKYIDGTISEEFINELTIIVDQMDMYLNKNDLQNWASCDLKFHKGLSNICANNYIISYYEKIHIQLNFILWFITPFYINKEISNIEHRKILNEIINKNPENARFEAQNHRNRVRNEIKKIVPNDAF